MINISLYHDNEFIRLRYDFTYLSSMGKRLTVDASNRLLFPAIEVFWIKSYDLDKNSYYISSGTNMMLNSHEKEINNLIQPPELISLNNLGDSLLETLTSDIRYRLVNGKIAEDIMRKVWKDIRNEDPIDVVSIEKTIQSKLYKRIDPLMFYFPELNNVWTVLADEYRLNESIPKKEASKKPNLLKF